jgi:hypothetical protein
MRAPTAPRPRTNAGTPAPPVVEVRTQDGQLLRRVALGAADTLVARGWSEWVGTGRRRYLRLTDAAPVSALHGWRGCDGTRPIRADGTCRVYSAGQRMGHARSVREHIAH